MNIKDQIIKGIENNINTLPEFITIDTKFDELCDKFKEIGIHPADVTEPLFLFYFLKEDSWLDYLFDHYTENTIDQAIADTTEVILQIGYVLMLLNMAEYKLLTSRPKLESSYTMYNDISVYSTPFETQNNIVVDTINKSGHHISFILAFTDISGRFFNCFPSSTYTLQITSDSINEVYNEQNANEFILKIVFEK